MNNSGPFALLITLTVFTICTCSAQDPIGDWIFDEEHVDELRVRDVAGGRDGIIQGIIEMYDDGNTEAILLNGENQSITVKENATEEDFPKREITVEAWVSIYKKENWGGIVSAFQDNGSSEQGWVLGYDSSYFYFGLASKGKDDGNGLMTYLRSETSYELQKWYHVVGTYSGSSQRIYVNGRLSGQSAEQSGDILYPESCWFDLGSYHDQNEFFRLKGLIKEIRLYDTVLGAGDIYKRFSKDKALAALEPPTPTPIPTPLDFVKSGPYLRFLGRDSAEVIWHTDSPCPSILEYGENEPGENRIEDLTPKTEHRMVLTGLGKDRVYRYQLKNDSAGNETRSDIFECETMFNYTSPAFPDIPSPFNDDKQTQYVEAAQSILETTNHQTGYCLIIGNGEGRLAYELAKRSNLHIIGVDTDDAAISNARKKLQQAGIYGTRITIRKIDDYSRIPFSQYFANLIVSERLLTANSVIGSAAEVYRLLRPGGGIACLGSLNAILPQTALEEWLNSAGEDGQSAVLSGTDEYGWLTWAHAPLPGIGRWSHQYGGPDNNANSMDHLLGATQTGDLQVQWIGRPGPRAMVDRNPRKPAPLSINGRLFTQGLHRMIAQDAYNGSILWSLEVPPLQRFNMPRDCSNWCADADRLFVAIENQCWRIDAQTGDVEAFIDVPIPQNTGSVNYDWGYIARSEDKLYGSAVKQGSSYTNFRGGSTEGWYDATTGPVTYKVCSDNVFALNPESGQEIWRYENGVIINTTIVIADGRVFFVECRNETIRNSAEGRIGNTALWQDQYLVALDQNDGNLIWEKPIDTANGIVVFYLLHGKGTLVLASSDTKYHLYGFDAENGESKWSTSHSWLKDNHGQHMQHPTIVGDTIFLRPRAYNINDGQLVIDAMPPHEGGCATFAGTEGALIYRGKEGCISMWDFNENKVTHWYSIRPGCWLSTIPAGGMVLSPEGGGGCSCGGWLETSIGFALKENL